MTIKNEIKNVVESIVLPGVDGGEYSMSQCLYTAFLKEMASKNKTAYFGRHNGFVSHDYDNIIEKIIPDVKPFLISGNVSRVYYNESSIISITISDIDSDKSASVFVNYVSTSKVEYDKLNESLPKYIHKQVLNVVYSLCSGPGGLNLEPIGKVDSPLIKENYEDSIIKDYEYIVDRFKSDDPHGRLAIISGPPGTGKTYLTRGLIHDLSNCMCVIIPPKLISELDGPTLIPLFVNSRKSNNCPILLIIEDADACLAPRGTDNISSISTLLNNTDGILGSILDFRVVATTNQKSTDFDEALLRPGRLCKSMSLEYLKWQDANDIYARLSGKDIKPFSYHNKKITLASVYAELYGNDYEKDNTEKTFGFVK